MLRAYFILYRGRLIAGALVALLTVIATVTMLAWNWCGCPPGSNDSYNTQLSVVLSSDIAGGLLAIILGLAVPLHSPGAPNEARYLLTRPMSRVAIQFYPLAISIAALALLPLLSWLVVLCHLWAAHGPQASFPRMIYALQPGRCYLAVLSVGLALYAALAAQRWFLLSCWKAIRVLGGSTIFLIIVLPMTLVPFVIRGSSFATWMLLLPSQQGGFTYLPSTISIGLHLVFAAVWIGATFLVLREIEA